MSVAYDTITGGHLGIKNTRDVEKVRDAPRPTTKKEIRSFLGLVGYYQPCIPNFAAIAAPLSILTSKGQPDKVVCVCVGGGAPGESVRRIEESCN
ncbi:hypothetical protein RRG08_041309 [Elysia crispata]|uniref:Uncharacterized protein n=1 Tax=Elysia crispata TaxID=231223 RepID=A0AAE0ZVS0_9GAST|nr:hypothetical protein RRG08_041309 [Elysia crispata]